MSLEVLNTIGTVGTFAVITATAIAAVIQLRHMRSNNQIAALNEVRETLESANYQDALLYVAEELPKILTDPQRRQRLDKYPLDGDMQGVSTVCNFFEGVGALMKHQIVDREIALDLWSWVIQTNWNRLAPFIALRRKSVGSRSSWENFEYATVLARAYTAEYPDGVYPRGVPRIDLGSI
jgi:hypothetical protein